MVFLIGKHPYVDLKVFLPSGKRIRTDCLIDTGFSGGLVLPEDLKDEFLEDKFIKDQLKTTELAPWMKPFRMP